jgi:hypothetical protein
VGGGGGVVVVEVGFVEEEEEGGGRESRRRASWAMRDSRSERRDFICDSVESSSGDGWGGRVVELANCEYVWKRVSVWDSRVRMCWRREAQPVPEPGSMMEGR